MELRSEVAYLYIVQEGETGEQLVRPGWLDTGTPLT
jgi:hypothetical protein